MENENPDNVTESEKPKKRNRRHTSLVWFLVLIFVVFLFMEEILYIPFLPRDLDAYHKSPDEGGTYYIQPIGQIDSETIAYLKEFIERDSKMPVVVLDPIPIPKLAWGSPLQVNADFLIAMLESQIKTKQDAFRLIGYAPVDMYSGDLAFVLGLSSFDKHCTVISEYMLRPRDEELNVISKPEGKDLELYHTRIRKILRHEIGHTFRIYHCINPVCVMSFANSVAEQDSQREYFCPICQVRLGITGNNQ